MNQVIPLRQAYLTTFRDALAAFFLQAEELLFALAGQAGEGSTVDLHLDTLRYLRSLRRHGAQAIADRLRLQWEGAKTTTPADPKVQQALERLALHAQALHFSTLAAIEKRLQAAGPHAPLSVEELRPQAIGAAIAAYLGEHPAPLPIQLLLVRLLDQLLVPAMDGIYQNIKQALQAYDRMGENPHPAEGTIDHAATGVMDGEALLAHLDAIQGHVCKQTHDPTDKLPNLRGVPELPHDVVLTPELQRLMDLMSVMVYDALTDPHLASSLKPVLLRMRLPLMKAVLLDQAVLHDAQHPARQLWNRLLDLARLPHAEQAPWRSRVERIINNLCADFAHDLGIFAAALDKLRIVEHLPRDIAPAMERTVAQRRPATGFNEARAATTQAIRAVLAAHGTVMPAVRTLLLQTWGPLMLLIAQQTGPQGDAWEQALDMMQTLVRLTSADGQGDAIEPLLCRMEEMLKGYGLEQKGFHKTFAELRQALANTAKEPLPSALSPPPANDTSPPPAQPPALPQSSFTLPRQVIEEFMRMAFQPGDWFLVHVGAGQVARRLKAYHVDMEAGVVVFADRLEQPVLECPLQQFIDDVLAGRSHPIFEDERHGHALRQLRQHIFSSSPVKDVR